MEKELFQAAKSGDVQAVESLIKRGVNLEAKDTSVRILINFIVGRVRSSY